METVGNCQKSGMDRGWGYDGSPPSGSRRNRSSWASLSLPSRKARA